MRLHTMWRSWLDASFANQITVFAVSLTLAVSLLIGVGSYAALQAQIKAAIQQDLVTQTHLIERRISYLISQASAELATLSKNSFMANGLVDSRGRDVYLQPFLRDFRLSTPGNEDTSLTLYDFRGKPFLEVSPDKAIVTADGAELVRQAIATGKPQGRIITHGNQTYLKLVHPIHFPPTQSVEGALAVRIQLAPLLAGTGIGLAEGQVLQLHAAGALVAQSGAGRQDVLHVERALKLAAPFDSLGLRLTLGSSMRDADGPLDRLTLIYVAGTLFLLPLVGWLTHRSSRRLAAPLAHLSATAEAIASSGVITVPLEISGSNEVGRLADAFGRMLARLGATQADLNQQAASLLASEKLLQSVLDSALDAFIRINAQGQVTDWNLQAERMFGYSRADAVGKLLENLIIPPSLRTAHRHGLDHFLKTGEGPLLGKLVEVTAVRASGGELPVEIAIVESRSGDTLSFNAFIRDISVRKHAEKEIRQLNVNLERRVLERTAELNQFQNTLDQTLEAVFIFDPESLRFTYVNEGARRQTGYSQTELMHMTPVEIKPQFTLEEFQHMLQPLTAGVLPSLTFETVHRHKSGLEIPVEIFLQIVRLDGLAPRFVAMVTDISARKQTQDEILQLNAELEERVRKRTAQLQTANQDLEAFSYSVSHDLRSPLNTIDGFSSLLVKEMGVSAATERGKHYLARIRSGVVQMGGLIDALLALAQVSRTSLRRESVDLSALAETVLNAYREREPGRAVQLAIQPGLVVQGDPSLLRQVLENLLGNAWKYSSKQPQTHIIFRRESGPDGVAVYTVQDHGAGFDMAYSDKLFGVFQRLHTASEFEGTGIGLATVHKIITRHGGRIWAESAPGQGATFYFTLGA